jgi:uncharacterized protein
VKQHSNGYVSNRVLKLNVGFLLAAGPGHSHETAFDVPRVRVSDDVELEYIRGPLRLSRTKEGILVQGHLHIGLLDQCYRCLEDVEHESVITVEELYTTQPASGASEFNVLDDAILDLAPLLRAEAIIADSQGVLCQPDCRGLCLECGTNLNREDCNCEQDDLDPRFAVLKKLLNNQ